MKKEKFSKFFKMSKLQEKELDLDNVLKMIEIINEVDTSGEEFYEKDWIKMKLRDDKDYIDHSLDNFGKRKDGYYVLTSIMKGK